MLGESLDGFDALALLHLGVQAVDWKLAQLEDCGGNSASSANERQSKMNATAVELQRKAEKETRLGTLTGGQPSDGGDCVDEDQCATWGAAEEVVQVLGLLLVRAGDDELLQHREESRWFREERRRFGATKPAFRCSLTESPPGSRPPPDAALAASAISRSASVFSFLTGFAAPPSPPSPALPPPWTPNQHNPLMRQAPQAGALVWGAWQSTHRPHHHQTHRTPGRRSGR